MLPLWLRYPAHKFCPAAPKIPALTGYLTFGVDGVGDGPRRYRGNVGKEYDTRTASAGLAGSGMGLQSCIEKLEPRKLCSRLQGIDMVALVVHWELGTHDAGWLGEFYTGLFDWRIEKAIVDGIQRRLHQQQTRH